MKIKWYYNLQKKNRKITYDFWIEIGKRLWLLFIEVVKDYMTLISFKHNFKVVRISFHIL